MVGYNLLSADTLGYADHIRTDTMGVQSVAEMGGGLGKVANSLFDSAFLWRDALLRRVRKSCNYL